MLHENLAKAPQHLHFFPVRTVENMSSQEIQKAGPYDSVGHCGIRKEEEEEYEEEEQEEEEEDSPEVS
ncbi:hypothetical protein ACRRTK_012249 [Alexandromys fortis]